MVTVFSNVLEAYIVVRDIQFVNGRDDGCFYLQAVVCSGTGGLSWR